MTQAATAQEGAGNDTEVEKVVTETVDTKADAKADATLIEGDDGKADKADAKETVADWRARLAGEDKSFSKVLGRYADEAAFGKAHKALLDRMKAGELKRVLPENPTEDELKAWRKETGIPEEAKGYVEKLSLPKGLVLGEADKPVVADFAEAALRANVPPAAFNELVSQYYAIQDKQRAAQEDADAKFKTESEDVLREAWQGADYRRNLNAVGNLTSGWPEDVRNSVFAARDPQGRLLGNNPAFLRELANLAAELNPAATLVPASGSDAGKTISDELNAIREMRRNNPGEYDANRAKYEAREIEIIEAQQKMTKRGKQAA